MGILRPYLDLDAYLRLLEEVQTLDHGRIEAMIHGVMHQHMAVARRSMAFQYRVSVYETEMKVHAAMKRLKLGIEPGIHYWLLEHAGFVKVCTGDKTAWQGMVDLWRGTQTPA